MSPRKSPEGRVAKWSYTMYKRQGKKLTFGPFQCPLCARNLLVVKVDKKKKEVGAICGCGLEASLDYSPTLEPIDYYNRLMDQLRKGMLK